MASGVTKADLVQEVVRATQLQRKQAEVVVSTVIQSLVDSLQRREEIELRGFGSFRIRQRDARIGRNPRTGEKVHVPAKRIPYFRPGKALRELLDNG